jgi:hypothetical protein
MSYNDDQEPRPVSLLVPLCAGHLETGASGECLACRVERYEQTLHRLCDPFSTLTVNGMMQLAAEAVRPRGTRA